MSFFSSSSGQEPLPFPRELSVTIKKSIWEKLAGLFWGIVKIAVILFFVGLIVQGGNNTVQEFSKYEKTYYDEFNRTQTKNPEAKTVGVLSISGTILSENNAGFDPNITVSPHFISLLADTMYDDEIDAILITVNSPGGEVFAAEQITQAIDILKAKTKKPVYVVLETMAASGGYYVATSGTKIYAYPSTLLGNIGVRLDLPNIEGLMEKVGVKMQSVTSGELKTMGSPFREMTTEEEKIFSALIDESYDVFVDRIVTGRKISKKEVITLADGRIFSGKQGKENNLVDEIVHSLSDLFNALAKEMEAEKIQFVEITPRMSAFEKFLISVKTGVNPLSAELQGIQKTQFLAQ